MTIHDSVRGAKTHFKPAGCARSDSWRNTREIENVTCKACLKFISKYRLKNRSTFDKCPTFEVKRLSKTHIGLRCPCCAAILRHGGGPFKGDGDGHRCSHCECWEHGYYLKEV